MEDGDGQVKVKLSQRLRRSLCGRRRFFLKQPQVSFRAKAKGDLKGRNFEDARTRVREESREADLGTRLGEESPFACSPRVLY